jgi:hypothetical protein
MYVFGEALGDVLLFLYVFLHSERGINNLCCIIFLSFEMSALEELLLLFFSQLQISRSHSCL